MSAVNEISRIQDEDLLKKMWHETEDFGRKKEIRAHMYKLREERLKDLYSSSDLDDLRVITNKKTSFNQSMHTDALGDHSFASLKRKEIRDSESPTKDVSYRTKGSSSNEGWNISKIEERSEDGKSHKFAQSANRSGTEYIPQGKIDFEAKNSQEVTSFQDGDDKNFVKSHGTSSNSYITQEAVGGDANSSFRTSSTKSSSSSRTVTEQKSSYGDTIDYPKRQLVLEGVDNGGRQNISSSDTKITSHKNTSLGDDVDQQQRQITLEIVAGYDQNNTRSSTSTNTTSSRNVTEQKSYNNYARQMNVSDDMVVDKTTKVYTTDAPKELKSHPGYVEGRTKITRETRTLADGTVVTTTRYETKGADEMKSTSAKQCISSCSSSQDNKSHTISSKSQDEKFTSQRVIDDNNRTPKNKPTSRYYVEKTHTIPSATEDVQYHVQSGRDSAISEKRTDITRNEQTHVDRRYETTTQKDVTENIIEKDNSENVTRKTVHHIELENDTKTHKDVNIKKEVLDKNRVQQRTVATHDVNSVPLGTPIEIEINLTRLNDNQDREYVRSTSASREVPKTDVPTYDTPKRREPIKHSSEMRTKTKATDGQYDTTYRTDYTNKKISIEVSPTHDAFARSLRAVSPDRLSSRTSSKNLKSSNSSLRSSSSPEKSYYDRKHPSRMSPDRYTNGRAGSPTKKTNEKFSSTETITYRKPPSQRTSPDKSQKRKHSIEIKTTNHHSVTGKTDEDTYTIRQSPPKNKYRPSVPNDRNRYTTEIITDLDDISSTHSHSTITLNKTDKLRSESDSKTFKEIHVHDQKTTEKPDHLTRQPSKKDLPIDRPLKRTDTYEERCRQILGITGDSNEKRRSSLEKLRKKGSSISSQIDCIPKTSPEKPDEVLKSSGTPRQKSPSKQLQEFPAQIRRSPENKSERETPSSGPRKPSQERSPVKEYPSQNRKTPEKLNKQPSPSRSSPGRLPENRQNREPSSEAKKIQEFPSQVRKTPEKYAPSNTTNVNPKAPETEKLERRPSIKHSLGEYPSQRKPTPEKPNERSPSRNSPKKTIPSCEESDITYTNEENKRINQVNDREYLVEQKTEVKTDYNKTENHETDILEQSENINVQRNSPQKITKGSTYQDKNQVKTTKTFKDIDSNRNSNDEKQTTTNRNETEITIKKKYDSSKQQLGDISSVEEYTERVEDRIIADLVEIELGKDIKTNTQISEIDKRLKKEEDIERANEVLEDEQTVETKIDIMENERTSSNEYSTLERKSTKEFIPNQYDLKPKKTQTTIESPKTDTEEFINTEKTQMKKEVTEVDENTVEATEKSKTVSELVRSFTSTDSENVEDYTTGGRPSCQLPKKPDNKKEKVEITKKITEVEESSPPRKPSTQLQKQPISQSPNKNTPREQERSDNEPIRTTQQSPRTAKKTEENFGKPSSKNYPTVDKDVEVLLIQEILETDLSFDEDDRGKVPKQKHLGDSRIKKTPKQTDNSIIIDIQETIIIDSDDEITEDTGIERVDQHSKTTKNIICIEDHQVEENLEESEHELKEIEFATIKRKPKEHSPQTKIITPNKHKEHTRNNFNVRKNDEQKSIETSSKTKNVSKQTDLKKQTQRTPSSSSLSKKTTTQQKITKGNHLETEATISSVRKSQIHKQKIDTFKPKQSPNNKSLPNKTTVRKPQKTDLYQEKSFPSHQDDSEVVEEIQKKQQLLETYEGKTPVVEPFITKKTVSLLYSDDEDEKETTQLLIESEIVEKQPITIPKKLNKIKSPTTTTTELIDNEKSQNTPRKPKTKLDQFLNKNLERPVVTKKTEIPTKKELNRTNSKQNTLDDIETYDKTSRNNIHLRTNRVDETVNKKKTSSSSPQKQIPINKPLETSVKRTTDRIITKKPSTANIETTEKIATKISIKNQEVKKPEQRITGPTNSQKNTVYETKVTKTKQIKTDKIAPKSKPITKKVVEPEYSDEESLSDSLNESVTSSIIDLTTVPQETIYSKTERKFEKTTTQNSETISFQQPEISKQTKVKKYVPTKTIFNDRGTVDLQRSISSREATPDRVCPLPVTSDEEGVTPRYPDKVVEPDDGSSKRRHERLFETSIHEHSDTIQSKKIEEIDNETERRGSRINRVDNDDESLLTVNRKINKFLSTAEKLTENPIVDISQPAPKVERPIFEVNDDLKEDDCLLSVSDKVQKFITEAEHLTKNKDTEHRKSVNLEVKTAISNKINQFTNQQQTETDSRSSTQSKKPKDKESKYPESEPNRFTTKIDQDVFITTECEEIEKESDLYRTSKQSKITVNTEKGSTNTTAKTEEATDKTETTTEKEVVSDDETSSKPKKNSLKEFTPKTRRPSQEDKVILSSVSRLRSNESIKKAKAIFDSSESNTREEKFQKEILNRPSVFEARSKSVKDVHTKKTIDRSNVTPKRLDFSSEQEIDDKKVRPETNGRRSSERDVPGYMKPLDRNYHPRERTPELETSDHPNRKQHEHEQKTNEGYIPGYMKPLDRSVTHQHPQESSNLDSHTHKKYSIQDEEHQKHQTSFVSRDDVPGYMKPIDHSHKHQHETSSSTLRHSDVAHQKHYIYEGDTPGYMKPLDRSHEHHHEMSSSLVSEEHRHPDDTYHRHYIHEGDTPGYMKPLDRSHKHQHERSTSSLVSEEHRHVSKHSDDVQHLIHESDTPGYMKPLDRSQHHHPGSTEVQDVKHSSRHSDFGSDAHKHYTSIDWTHKSSNEDTTYKPRQNEDDTPGYMKPLDRSSRPQFDSLDRSRSPDRRSSIHSRPDVIGKEETPGYMKPLDRSSRPQFDSRESSKSPERHSKPHNYESDGDVPGYMKPLDRSSRPQFDRRERSRSPESHIATTHQPRTDSSERNLPGYMKPLDRKPHHDEKERSKSPENTDKYKKPTTNNTSKPNSPRKEISISKNSETTTKFGVTLKRTDSGRVVTSSVKTDKKHPLLAKKNITEEEIDEIFDLELLEELLLKFTIYEIRRRIRTQIKIVKKLISEGKLEVTIQNLKNKSNITNESAQSERISKKQQAQEDMKLKKMDSRSKFQENVTSSRNDKNNEQERISTHRSDIVTKNRQEVSEYKVSSSRKESFSSTYTSERSESRRSVSPEKQIIVRNQKTPERASPERKQSTKSNTERNVTTEETKSYQSKYTTNGTSNNISKSNLKKTEPKTKTPSSATQPEWVTQRNLKKIGTNELVKKSASTSSKQTTSKSRYSEKIESTDLIASSYGIGPTDENGAPLFGLRALRAQNSNGTTKVQGAVISSEYYSETGKEPVGQISVTKYSSDPRDLGSDENLRQNGDILSVTTTQRYGYEDSPSLKQLTKTNKEICDSQTNRRKSSTKTSTIVRKNSVKALTQKFVENADEKKKNERQTSYPKAGLILRSSSFKNESEIEDSQSGYSAEERIEKSVSVKSSKSTSGSTFLSNKSKVTGVQDAISRMKTKDVQYGDAEEDVEAKDLLNKYLGSQVILSGLEGHISKTGTASSSSSFTASAKSTSRITTVTMENGKEVKKTRTFEHPVSDEVLETVWDEQTLRYLLEQSTDYEERKRIRARLRVIMAEQEACTELVKQASQDQSSQSIDEKIETSREVVTEGPVTTTKVTRVSSQQHVCKKPLSPFAKFRQLDKQNSLNTPPSTPRTPGGSPLFKFTDAALSQSASTIKDRLLYWCRMKTKEYENIQLDNFSSSWADGLAFCALIHHFLPDAFDYHALTPKERRHNFTLAFKVADEKADIAPLLDVDDMVATMRPDWKCVFTYVQSIYRRFKDED